MQLQFTHPIYLLLLVPALAWVLWFALKSDVQVGAWRKWMALIVRTIVVFAIVFAIAGLQWLLPVEGMNVFFVLDRSDSVPTEQQETAKNYLNPPSSLKKNSTKVALILSPPDAPT